AEIYGPGRRNARGADLGDPGVLAELRQAVVSQREQGKREQGKGGQGTGGIPVYNPANSRDLVGSHPGYASGADMVAALSAADAAFASWSQTPRAARSSLLERFADGLERRRDEFLALCVREAGKTLAESLAEIREAVDFCRYYARQAEEVLAVGQYRRRGVLLCIRPWNFPLAIFVGQVVAALVAGHTVVARPAEHTSLEARRAVGVLRGPGGGGHGGRQHGGGQGGGDRLTGGAAGGVPAAGVGPAPRRPAAVAIPGAAGGRTATWRPPPSGGAVYRVGGDGPVAQPGPGPAPRLSAAPDSGNRRPERHGCRRHGTPGAGGGRRHPLGISQCRTALLRAAGAVFARRHRAPGDRHAEGRAG